MSVTYLFLFLISSVMGIYRPKGSIISISGRYIHSFQYTAPPTNTLHWRHTGVWTSQITSQSTVYSTAYAGQHQRGHQNPTLPALCVGNPPVTGGFPHKGSVKCFVVAISFRIASLAQGLSYNWCGVSEATLNDITKWTTWRIRNSWYNQHNQTQHTTPVCKFNGTNYK